MIVHVDACAHGDLGLKVAVELSILLQCEGSSEGFALSFPVQAAGQRVHGFPAISAGCRRLGRHETEMENCRRGWKFQDFHRSYWPSRWEVTRCCQNRLQQAGVPQKRRVRVNSCQVTVLHVIDGFGDAGRVRCKCHLPASTPSTLDLL